jgi:Na+/H+ antiporter NhaD/arsenite permease-like protein
MCSSHHAWADDKAEKAPAAATESSAPAHDKAENHEHAGAGHAAQGHHGTMGKDLSPWSVASFAILLLCIAVLPLASPHWWEHNSNKAIVVALLSIPLVIYLLMNYADEGAGHELFDKVKEYVSFMALLGALYVISGGIYIKGSLNGTPLANTALLGLGAVIASIIGTTGASVLLIRPLLRANKTREAKAHIVVFFIFIVSNCGGLLTPLGDPPLFLGFMKGVDFFWTTTHLWQHWLAVNIALLVIFNVYDQIVLDREEKAREGSQLEAVMKHEPIGIDGSLNFLFLAAIVGVIIATGKITLPWGAAEVAMLVIAALAYLTTAANNREQNKFTFGPIIEVAVLFIGIFITMTPALLILNAWGKGDRLADLGAFPFQHVWQYFWATGILSSFLDNAPTYLTFAATACGQQGVDTSSGMYLKTFLEKGEVAQKLMEAISCAAVFMGANTYIGNGPNFMVKAIAEENGVKMPSFFGYMAYSCSILVPLFIVMTFVFFRG